jgi:hypothetical protein
MVSRFLRMDIFGDLSDREQWFSDMNVGFSEVFCSVSCGALWSKKFLRASMKLPRKGLLNPFPQLSLIRKQSYAVKMRTFTKPDDVCKKLDLELN